MGVCIFGVMWRLNGGGGRLLDRPNTGSQQDAGTERGSLVQGIQEGELCIMLKQALH